MGKQKKQSFQIPECCKRTTEAVEERNLYERTQLRLIISELITERPDAKLLITPIEELFSTRTTTALRRSRRSYTLLLHLVFWGLPPHVAGLGKAGREEIITTLREMGYRQFPHSHRWTSKEGDNV